MAAPPNAGVHVWVFLLHPKAEEVSPPCGLSRWPAEPCGTPLTRPPSPTGFYSLSVRHRQGKHYRIFRLPNNWYYISPRLTFQCLEDLVNHYSGKKHPAVAEQ